MNMTETKTLETFISEYYDNVQLSTFTEKDVQDVWDSCMTRYSSTVAGDYSPDVINGSELDKINYALNGANLLYILRIGAIESTTLSAYMTQQDAYCEYAKKLLEGYKPCSSKDRTFNKYNHGNRVGFVLFKPEQVQEKEKEQLKEQIRTLLQRKCEIENDELLAPEEAKAYGLQKLCELEEQKEQALHLRAALAAVAAKQRLLASGNTELTELLKESDWVTFENVKEVLGESNNAKVESLLTENSFVKKRKYISDKQAVLWIREGKESEIDFKAITL